jgi:hypothetical protein
MHKHGIGLVVALTILLTVVSPEVYGENEGGEMCVPLGIITLRPPEGVESQKAPVEFPHAQHFQTECRACHHKWQGSERIQSCTASGCHDQIKAPEKSNSFLSYSDVSITYYKYAFHKACIGCHREIKIKNRALAESYQVVQEQLPSAGPSGCIECHPEY